MTDDEKEGGAPCARMQPHGPGEWPMSRRDFVKAATVVVGASTLPAAAHAADGESPRQVPVSLTINGEQKQVLVDPRTTLLDLLREDLKLTGTKKGCDHGQCGACTVLVNERRVNSCLSLVVAHEGDSVTTIEGIAKGDVLDPVQQAFLDHDGYQCGYCTPGQIVSAVALLNEAKAGAPSYVTVDLQKTGPVKLTTAEIQERMSGNVCRCGAYPGIVAAVHQAFSGAAQQTGDDHAAV